VSPLFSHLEYELHRLTSSSGTSNPTPYLTHLDWVHLEPRSPEKMAVAMSQNTPKMSGCKRSKSEKA
jgi:hypothetical protein